MMRSFIGFFLLIVVSGPSQASGMPTYDFFNHVEQLLQTAEQKLVAFNTKVNNNYQIRQIRNQIKQLEEARMRFNQLKRQYEALSGKNGYGRWLHGPARLATREYAPKSSDELLEIMRGGRSTGEYARDREAWMNVYLPPDPLEGRYEKEDTPETYQKRALIDSAGSLELVGKRLYNDTQARLETIDDLLTEVDETENIKQSMDLLNVNVAELHRTMEKLLTLQTLMARRASVIDTGTINNNRNEQEFMKW